MKQKILKKQLKMYARLWYKKSLKRFGKKLRNYMPNGVQIFMGKKKTENNNIVFQFRQDLKYLNGTIDKQIPIFNVGFHKKGKQYEMAHVQKLLLFQELQEDLINFIINKMIKNGTINSNI